MKYQIAVLSLTVALLTGCAMFERNPQAPLRIASHAAYDVSSVLLASHPEWRPQFQRAKDELSLLAKQVQFDALTVIEILQRIPVKELKTPTARIAFDAGLLIIELSGDPALKPKAQESLRLVVLGLESGVGRALAE